MEGLQRFQQLRRGEQFGSDAPDYDIEGIRAAYRKNPKVVEKHLRKVEASKQVAEMMKDAPKLREEDLDRRLAQLRPKEGSHHIAEQQEVYEKAEKRVEKLLEQRRTDPAAAVAGTPQVKGVTDKLENGQPKNQAEAFQLVNARLNSQRLLGIAPQNQRPLTNAEAKRLAQPLMNVDEGRAEEVLQQVNEKVVKAFGHKYSGIIMKQVADHAFSDKARKDSLFQVLRGMDEEGRVAPTDMERAREMYRVRTMEKAIGAPAGEQPPTPSEQFGTGIFPGSFGQLRKRIEFFGQVLGGGPSPQQQDKPAKREVVPARKPPPAAIEHLRQNPTLAPQFEQRYGTGTARQYLLK